VDAASARDIGCGMSKDSIDLKLVPPEEIPANHERLAALLLAALTGAPSGARWPLKLEVASTLRNAMTVGAVTIVAERAGRTVGALFAEVEGDARVAFVRWVAVDPAERRRGVGRCLVEHLEATTPATRVEGMVDLDDSTAVAFWRSHGWKRSRPLPRHIRMGRDLLGASR
jgi:GNAT superfamily N-acetyltransferase